MNCLRQGSARSVTLCITGLVLATCGLMMTQTDASSQLPGDATQFKRCLWDNGIAYGGFRDGQGPDAGIYPTTAQIEEDMVFLSHLTRRVRTYTSQGAFATIPAVAEHLGMRATMGVALSGNSSDNDGEIESALKLARAGLVNELIIGNEVFTGHLLSKVELVDYLRRVRREAPSNVLISTAELAGQWESNLDLVMEVDFVVVHFYPFWEGSSIDGAGAGILERFNSFQQVIRKASAGRDLRIVIGETGWPSGGVPSNPMAIPSAANQRRFAEEFLAVACANSIPFYWFSLLDEEWKWREGRTSGGNPLDLPRDRTFTGNWIGSSWGIFQSNGVIKRHFAGLLDQPPIGSRRHRDIFVDGQLATYYDIGVDTSGLRRDWLATPDKTLRMSYPSRQEWGAVFVTVGKPVPTPRPWKDFSEFEILSVELRGERGVEFVDIGVKDYDDPDDGSEMKVTIGPLTTDFVRYEIELRRFGHSDFVVPEDLRRLYVVIEFVFSGHTPQTIYARNIRYLSTD